MVLFVFFTKFSLVNSSSALMGLNMQQQVRVEGKVFGADVERGGLGSGGCQ